MDNEKNFLNKIILSAALVFFVLGFTGCGKNKEDEKTEKPRSKTENTIKHPDTFVFADYGTLRTLDPCVSYDVVGRQKILNIYDLLIEFKGSKTDEFVPSLAVEVPTVENGGISRDGLTYTFKIRQGVKFQNGNDLTAEDVAYAFKRNMITDPAGGPMWMILEALTGEGSTRDTKDNILPGIFEKIDKIVEYQNEKVIFHLPAPYPPFMGILAYASSVVLDKAWSIENGCWDGKIENAVKFNNPAPGYEPLQKKANGTGAYIMKSWEPSKEFVFERFDGYWGKKPSLKTAVVKYVKEWSTRKLMLQNGDADRVQIDLQYLPEVRKMKGIKLYEVPQLELTAALFCQKVNPAGNPNIGSGRLDGNGIPADFFSDINVRKAFLHAMDRKTYRKDVFNDLVISPTSPNVEGLPYHKDVPVYEFDLKKSTGFMKKAWNGNVWENGFKMVVTYNTGNEMRQAAALMLAENIMSLNPKFRIEVRNVDWKDYTVKYRDYRFPIFIIGWGADYADPHNFLYTFMHSQGVYGRYMAYKNQEVDELCDAGIKTVMPGERDEIYTRLQNLWYTEAIGLPLYQRYVVLAYRDYVKGFVPHPLYDDSMEILKNISKSSG